MNVTIKISDQNARVFETLLQNRYGRGRKIKLENLLYKAIREIVAEQAEQDWLGIESQNPDAEG